MIILFIFIDIKSPFSLWDEKYYFEENEGVF